MSAFAKDALELIQRSGTDRARPFVLNTPGIPSHQLYVWMPSAATEAAYGGTLEKITLDPKPISYRASNVQGFIEAVKRAYTANEPENFNMAVYVNKGRVVCWLDEATRRDLILLNLTYSDAFKGITNGMLTNIEQKPLVRVLRTLFSTGVTPDTFLSAVRNLKFTSNAEGQSEVQHGKESLGRNVLKKVSGATDIAEEITLSGQVFEEVDFTGGLFHIKMVVDIDVEEGRFSLIPIAGQVYNALADADQAVAREIRYGLGELSNKVTVICGCGGE